MQERSEEEKIKRVQGRTSSRMSVGGCMGGEREKPANWHKLK